MIEPDLFPEPERIDNESCRTPFQNQIPTCLHNFGFLVAWGEFCADRKERRLPVTSRAAKMLLRTLAERPKEAEHALNHAIKKAWRGFEWEWMERPDRNAKKEEVKTPTDYQKEWSAWIKVKGGTYLQYPEYQYAIEFMKIDFHAERKGKK